MNNGGLIRVLTKVNFSKWQTKNDKYISFSSPLFCVLHVCTTFFSPSGSWSKVTLYIYKFYITKWVRSSWGTKLSFQESSMYSAKLSTELSITQWLGVFWMVHQASHPQPVSVCQVQWGGGGKASIMLIPRTLPLLLRLTFYESLYTPTDIQELH